MTFGAAFLHEPDLFPRRLSGEPWGDGALDVTIAGLPFAIRGLSDPQAEAARNRYRELLDAGDGTPRAAKALDLLVFRAPAGDFREIDTRGWETTFDFDFGADSVAWAGRDTMARFERARRPGSTRAALWTPAGDAANFPGILENVLRVLVAHRALALGGVLLHSAGVAVDGEAHLFVGRSGAGKTTLCGLSRDAGHAVLSDELNAVLVEDGRPRLLQLPFAGDFGGVALRAESYPLASVSLLVQGPEPRRNEVSAGRAHAALVAAAPFVNTDPASVERLEANLDALVAAIRPRELVFRLAPDFWSILLEGR